MAAAVILKFEKSPYLGRSYANSTKFGTVMQFHPLDRSDRWKIEILKIRAVN